MIIKIPDHITSKRRRRLLKVLPIQYALEKFNYNRSRAADFLGMSSRSLRDQLKLPELVKYRNKPRCISGIRAKDLFSIIYDCHTIDDFLDIVKSKPAYTTLETEKEKILFIKSMVNNYEEIKQEQYDIRDQ